MRIGSVLGSALPVAGVVIVAMAQTRREDAVLNISTYFDWVPYGATEFLAPIRADVWATWLGLVLIAAGLVLWAVRRASGNNASPVSPPISNVQIAPQRDATLREGLGYAVSGKWRVPTLDSLAGNFGDLLDATDRFNQLAADGALTTWGKPYMESSGVFRQIPAEHWLTHRIVYPSGALVENTTEHRLARDFSNSYQEIMVSRAQFEKEWPHEG